MSSCGSRRKDQVLRGLGYWKLAITAEGVWSRYRSGAYGEGDEGFERFGNIVEPLLDGAQESTGRAGR